MNSTSTRSGASLMAEAGQAMQRGEVAAALALIGEAEIAEPRNPEVVMAKAVLLRASGNPAGALAAVERVLAIDPYHYFALLSKGALVEHLSGAQAASKIYRDVLKIAPSPERMPPAVRAQTEHARQVVAADQRALEDFILAKLKTSGETRDLEAPFRFQESLQVLLGKARPQIQQPLFFEYTQLPAIPFYPRDMFPWFKELEAATPIIQAELHAATAQLGDTFKPYIQYPAGAPVNQWAELNHSARWSTLFLWRDGVRQDEACRVCPQTAALLASLPMAQQPGFAPTAMFSRLDPHTRIPAHTGSSNVRLITHLPLVLPGPARFRVGNETRPWKMGEAWVFDDTIEHEAWNDADEDRVILIFDIWNPFLSETERVLITALMAAKNEYYRTAGGAST
jgi:aspartate beta-hydroxylase